MIGTNVFENYSGCSLFARQGFARGALAPTLTWSGFSRGMVHARPFVGVSQSQLFRDLVNFGDKCPQNGSKNDLMVPRTTMGCPHEGPRVARQPCGLMQLSQYCRPTILISQRAPVIDHLDRIRDGNRGYDYGIAYGRPVPVSFVKCPTAYRG